jgi:molecular chaperone DnaJ
MENNPYEILGVSSDCSEEELKKAYKQKCFEYHPDRFAAESPEKQKEAEEQFKKIQNAYNSIKDGSYGTSQQNEHFGGFSDFFSGLFSRFQTRYQQPSIIQAEIPNPIKLTFAEAISGCKKNLNYKLELNCFPCNGNGVVPSSISCKECDGKGVKTVERKEIFGFFRQTITCHVCGGSKKELHECKECKGKGNISYTLNEELEFESCNPTGKKIARKIQGIDYLFLVKVQTIIPEFMKVEFFNEQRILSTEYSVSVSDYLLGGKFKLNLEDGLGDFEFETKTGDSYVLIENRGFPHKGTRLPLKINIKPKFPTSLTEEQKNLLNNLKKLGL